MRLRIVNNKRRSIRHNNTWKMQTMSWFLCNAFEKIWQSHIMKHFCKLSTLNPHKIQYFWLHYLVLIPFHRSVILVQPSIFIFIIFHMIWWNKPQEWYILYYDIEFQILNTCANRMKRKKWLFSRANKIVILNHNYSEGYVNSDNQNVKDNSSH